MRFSKKKGGRERKKKGDEVQLLKNPKTKNRKKDKQTT